MDIFAHNQTEADYIRRNLYTEEDELIFQRDDQLSYSPIEGTPYVHIYVEEDEGGTFMCVMEVWNDSSNDDDPEREYLTINNYIFYLDEMKLNARSL